MEQFILTLDIGTTSTRALIFDRNGRILAQSARPLKTHCYQDGWVEQDPIAIVKETCLSAQQAIVQAHIEPKQLIACGITNQRETTILWDKKTLLPLAPAIVWQDTRTTDICEQWKNSIDEAHLNQKTGLYFNPYFSASKIAYLLNNTANSKQLLMSNQLAFGTVDSFVLAHLTAGQQHLTDISNASRTCLYNIRTACWDHELLTLFDIPAAILPTVKPNDADFGKIKKNILGHEIPVVTLIGDQQSALLGQNCLLPGDSKCTFGTGAFILTNCGSNIISSSSKLLTSVAWKIQNKTSYVLEGSMLCCGNMIDWLQQSLALFKHPSELNELANQVSSHNNVVLVPAFCGLGAPYWSPQAKASISGITFDTTPAHIVRAALMSIAFQTHDLIKAMNLDNPSQAIKQLYVDGGLTQCDWLMQYLANTIQLPIHASKQHEATAIGAAVLTAYRSGWINNIKDGGDFFSEKKVFTPNHASDSAAYHQWRDAVNHEANAHRVTNNSDLHINT